jgi:hypothetical protein
MGYTLRIGEAEIRWNVDSVDITVADVRLVDAPAHGDPTDFTNTRWPSYSSWIEFCRKLGIVELMFDERYGVSGEFEWNGKHYPALLVHHPGCAPISAAHAEYLEAKVDAYKAQFPEHRAEYPPPKPDASPLVGNIYRENDYVDDPRYDGALCRAEWLLFWLRWALDNCQRPVFVNS